MRAAGVMCIIPSAPNSTQRHCPRQAVAAASLQIDLPRTPRAQGSRYRGVRTHELKDAHEQIALTLNIVLHADAQASRYPTISLAWPRTRAVAAHAKNVRFQPHLDDPTKKEAVNHADLPTCARETAEVLVQEIEARFDEKKMPIEQMIAMALDPRTTGHVKALCTDMQQKIYMQLSAEVKELRKFLGVPEAQRSTPAPIEINDDNDDYLDSLSAPNMSINGEQITLNVTASADAPKWQKELDAEVLLYFQEPPMERAPKDFSPLLWWKEKKEKSDSPFVSLPVIAALYLSLASTAARNERTFSYAGRLLDSLRSTTQPDLVCDILFICRNLHLLERTVQKDVPYQSATGHEATTKVHPAPRPPVLAIVSTTTKWHSHHAQTQPRLTLPHPGACQGCGC